MENRLAADPDTLATALVCPSSASQQKGFEKEQLLGMIDAALVL